MLDEWGPLRALAGDWEGDAGRDVAFSHRRGEMVTTPYRERATLVPFGPVVNGRRTLFGLDHRTDMWRGRETVPFHSEVGYWLWDAAAGEVLRCFVVPRGITVLAGGIAAPDASELALAADLGAERFAIAESAHLAADASSLSYRAAVRVDGATWSYDEVTRIRFASRGEPVDHTDRNTLHRVA